MLDRARMEKELEVAVRPGVKVCRQLVVGIGNREWINGTVVEAGGGKIGVRIDNPGQFGHVLNGVEVSRGTVVWDAITEWTPCF